MGSVGANLGSLPRVRAEQTPGGNSSSDVQPESLCLRMEGLEAYDEHGSIAARTCAHRGVHAAPLGAAAHLPGIDGPGPYPGLAVLAGQDEGAARRDRQVLRAADRNHGQFHHDGGLRVGPGLPGFQSPGPPDPAQEQLPDGPVVPWRPHERLERTAQAATLAPHQNPRGRTSMKAAVLREVNKPLSIESVSISKPPIQ